MRFRVDKNLSLKQLDQLLLEHSKLYCAEVLNTGAMSGPALAQQRIVMQYYEALEEKRIESTTVPGQLGMFP